MPKRKKPEENEIKIAPTVEQPITETIEQNYMPYVMTVIISRAIPEIDGFKPSHRKLLYTMYKMGLMTGARTKSSNVVGQTMRLNPHGDMAIYETLVRLTRANESLLHPFIDSKGSFGKQYSRDMAFSAPRYTEVKLDPFCAEIFGGIDKNAVDFVPNYDNTTEEPVLLPTSFPNILVSPNLGIAVGMASNICSFNLAEICDGTIALLRNPNTSVDKLLDLVKAPDFPGGGSLIYDRAALKTIYETGRGSVRVRARWSYDKAANCIDIVQIPYTTTIEAIMKRLAELAKENKLREVTDFRDEIDLSGFKLTLDLRRGTDPDALMARLFRQTALEDEFPCNFNVLIDGTPRQIGVRDILNEWIRFRIGCVSRTLKYDLERKKEKLHLLLGLGKILLDIDKAIKIVRETEKESDVVPNLMAGFGIDEPQAEYIAEIRLRHLNREYILERIREIDGLQKEIASLTDEIGDELKIRSRIAAELAEIRKKYGKPRRTLIISASDAELPEPEETVDNYSVTILLTREGYFKKLTAASLRGNDEQKLKEGDVIINEEEAENKDELLVFTSAAQVYKSKIADFDTTKASAFGDFLAVKLGFDEGERPIAMKAVSEYGDDKHFIFIFENGKGVRVPVSAYETKTNRRRLTGAFSDASPVVAVIYEDEEKDLLLISNANKAILIKSSLISVKTTRTAAGIQLFTLKKGDTLRSAVTVGENCRYANPQKYRKAKVPAAGTLLSEADIVESQLGLK
jgi:DNA gyrase subunit A